MTRRSVLPFVLLTLLASCAAPPPPAPPAPPPMAQPAPLSADWRDWPVSAGGWRYGAVAGGSLASFGEAGVGATKLTLRCEKATRRIFVSRAVSAPVAGQMTLRTSFGAASWPIESDAVPTDSGQNAVAIRAAADAALDQMAFSRGRFAIEVPGAAPLVVPAWAEVGRVIEDCRS